MRGYLVSGASCILGRALLSALFVASTASAVAVQELRPVHYTCADGTRLQATFSPPSVSTGYAKLAYAGGTIEITLPQAVSADGGRYTLGDVEFWIKGNGATLTRASKSTTCRTSG